MSVISGTATGRDGPRPSTTGSDGLGPRLRHIGVSALPLALFVGGALGFDALDPTSRREPPKVAAVASPAMPVPTPPPQASVEAKLTTAAPRLRDERSLIQSAERTSPDAGARTERPSSAATRRIAFEVGSPAAVPLGFDFAAAGRAGVYALLRGVPQSASLSHGIVAGPQTWLIDGADLQKVALSQRNPDAAPVVIDVVLLTPDSRVLAEERLTLEAKAPERPVVAQVVVPGPLALATEPPPVDPPAATERSAATVSAKPAGVASAAVSAATVATATATAVAVSAATPLVAPPAPEARPQTPLPQTSSAPATSPVETAAKAAAASVPPSAPGQPSATKAAAVRSAAPASKSAQAAWTAAPAGGLKFAVEGQAAARAESASRLRLTVQPVETPPAGAYVVLRGLPVDSRIARGLSIGPDAWLISLAEIANLDVDLPGAMPPQLTLGAKLVTIDGKLIAEETVRFARPSPAPAAVVAEAVRSAPQPAQNTLSIREVASTGQAATALPSGIVTRSLPQPPAAAAPSPPAQAVRSAPPAKAAAPAKAVPAPVPPLVARGRKMLQMGNVAMARPLLERAAIEGSGEAAAMLGASYDLQWLRRAGAVGVADNPEQAKRWYAEARKLGTADVERIAASAAPAPRR